MKNKTDMKIGVFGGTFDPFTSAHYEIVNKVLSDKLVDKVIVIPTIVNYYRTGKTELFDLADREKIIKKWFEGREDVILDFYEYGLLAWNIKEFKADTLLSNRRYYHMLIDIFRRYENYGDVKYFTIVGGDSWDNLSTWYNWKELGKETEFIVVTRYNQDLAYYGDDEEVFKAQPAHAFNLDDRVAEISATKLRKHLEEACEGMSMGPNGTPFNIYLDEIDDYKKTRKTWLDREKEYDSMMKLIGDNVSHDRLLAHTPIFDLVEAPEVEAGFKPVKVKSQDWVSIIVEKDGKFLMVKQLRYGLNAELEEFPCGMIEKDEDVIDAGLRELEEETGNKILDRRSVHYLGKFAANPAFMTNYMHYLHVNLDWAQYEVKGMKLDSHEHLTAYWTDKKEAFNNFMRSQGSSLMGCAWMLCMKNGIA